MTQSGHSDQNHLWATQRSPVHLKLTAERLILPVIKLRFGMIIKRIVPNISATDLSKARRFYGDILRYGSWLDCHFRIFQGNDDAPSECRHKRGWRNRGT